MFSFGCLLRRLRNRNFQHSIFDNGLHLIWWRSFAKTCLQNAAPMTKARADEMINNAGEIP
jgi:hypothetical protein